MSRHIGYIVCFLDEAGEIEGIVDSTIGDYRAACAALRRARQTFNRMPHGRLRIVRLDGSVHRPGALPTRSEP